MAAVWSDQNKFQRWLDVEVAACEAWAELGQVPGEAAAKIRRDASFDVEKINEYIRITHHDVTAFLRSVAETLGEEGRYVHFGLTSSDVWDTATGEAVTPLLKHSGDIRFAFMTRRNRLITASDQQGNYIPSTPIHIVRDLHVASQLDVEIRIVAMRHTDRDPGIGQQASTMPTSPMATRVSWR